MTLRGVKLLALICLVSHFWIGATTWATDQEECEVALQSHSSQLLQRIEAEIRQEPFLFALGVKKLLEIRQATRAAFPALQDLRSALNTAHLTDEQIESVAQRIYTDALALLESPSKTDLALAGAREALKLLPQLSARAGQINHAPPEMQAHNKDVSNRSEKTDPSILAETSIPRVAYWPIQRFAKIDFASGRASSIPNLQEERTNIPQIPKASAVAGALSVYVTPFSPGPIEIPIPFGYVVSLHGIGKQDIRVDSAHRVIWNPGTQTALSLPLVEQKLRPKRLLTPSDTYLEAPPLLRALLPAPLAEAIEQLEKQKGDRSFAQGIAQKISTLFEYAEEADDQTTTTLERLHSNKFQCDTAAVILAWILRTHKIPARMVGGYHTPPSALSRITLPTAQHAWVEAYVGGEWIILDATPSRKPNTGKTEPAPSQETQKSGSDPEEQNKAPPKQPQNNPQKEKAKIKQTLDNQSEKSVNQSGFTEILERYQRLARPLLRELLGWATELSVPVRTRMERIQKLTELAQRDRIEHRNSIYSALIDHPEQGLGALRIHYNDVRRQNEADIFTEISATLLNAPTAAPAVTMENLQWFIHDIDLHTEWLPAEHSALPKWQELRNQLVQLRKAVQSLQAPDGQTIRTAQEFFDRLPGQITREILSTQFQIPNTGDVTAAAKEITKELESGRLNDYVLASRLASSAWVPLDSTPLPRGRNAATWWEAPQERRTVKVLLPTQDPRQRDSALQLNPQLSESAAWASGEKYVLAHRQQVSLPDGLRLNKPSGAVVILADISGSMKGDREHFMVAWITALVDQALSQGKQAVVIPFSEDVSAPILIRSIEEAKAVLPKLRSHMQSSALGTDITRALIAGATWITAAADSGDQLFSRATLALVSDGDDAVQVAAVEKAFSELTHRHPQLKLTFGAVSLGGDNPTLGQLASRFTHQSGEAFYLARSQIFVSHAVRESRSAPTQTISSFWSEHSWPEALTLQPAIGSHSSSLAMWVAQNITPSWRDSDLPSLADWGVWQSRDVSRAMPSMGIRSVVQSLPLLKDLLSLEERQNLVRALLQTWAKENWIQWDQLTAEDVGALEALRQWGNGG